MKSLESEESDGKDVVLIDSKIYDMFHPIQPLIQKKAKEKQYHP